jgi:hypothetical protein
MVKRRGLAELLLCLLVSLSAPALGVGQEPGSVLPHPALVQQPQTGVMPQQDTLPHPGVMSQTPGTPVMMPAVNDHLPAETPGSASCNKLRRVWQFITFHQPPRPRECQGCLCSSTDNRCTPPLYQFFTNRFPAKIEPGTPTLP